MTTLNNHPGTTATHFRERTGNMFTENPCPPTIVTEDGAVYLLSRAPEDPSQLNVDVTVQLHHKLRLAAEAHNVTLKEFVQETLAARLNLEETLYARS